MSASTAELQIPVNELLLLIGATLSAGQIVVHLAEGRVQKVEINSVIRPRPNAKDSAP